MALYYPTQIATNFTTATMELQAFYNALCTTNLSQQVENVNTVQTVCRIRILLYLLSVHIIPVPLQLAEATNHTNLLVNTITTAQKGLVFYSHAPTDGDSKKTNNCA